MRGQKGFSLIELLIVVTIILVIAAIAIPNLLRSRMAANEASAVSSLRTINTAQITYASAYPDVGFAPDLNTLGPGPIPGNIIATSANAVLIDNTLGCSTGVGTTPCTFSGYNIFITAGTDSPISSYSTNASPVSANQTGTRYFYSDASGLIRYNASTLAGSADDPIQ